MLQAYKKRAGAIAVDKEDYNALKHNYEAAGTSFFPSANDLVGSSRPQPRPPRRDFHVPLSTLIRNC